MAHVTGEDRPIWLRVVQFPLLRIVVLGALLLFLMGWTEGRLQMIEGQPWLRALVATGLGLVAIVLYLAWGRFLERRAVTELALPGAGRDIGLGLLMGAVLYSACVVVLIALGEYRIQGLNPVTFLIPALAMAIKSGIFEELIFRGVLLRSVEDMAGTWAAVIVSSAAFGLVHLMNPDATMGGALYISIEAGLLLAGAYLLTRRLWLCIGFHMGWNYVQSAVFSGIVSGAVNEPGLLRAVIEGPDLFTGGNFGMERSIFALIFCTAAGIVMLVLARRLGHILPPPWMR
jgi:hypothetical protein